MSYSDIARAIKDSKEKEETLSRVVVLREKAREVDIWGALEERVTRTVPIKKLERLYRVDGLTFRSVNKIIEYTVGPGFFLEGNEEICKELMEWSDEVNLKKKLKEVIRDIYIAGGNAWIELGYSKDGNDILLLTLINPSTMDYIRKLDTSDVEVDPKTGEFIGFKRQPLGFRKEVEYRKDIITVDKKIVWKARRTKDDGRDRICHFKLFGFGESYLGMSPLESSYFDAIVRLNISKTTGEGAFRRGGIVAKVKTSPTGARPSEEQLDNVAEDLKNVESETVFVFRDNVDLERFPSPELRESAELIYTYADMQCMALGTPLGILLHPPRGYKTDIPNEEIDFALTIQSIQEDLADQVRDKIFRRVLKARNKDPKLLKKVVFKTRTPIVRRERSREIATLARRGLISRDPEVELRLREELNLPTTFVQRELTDWTKDKSKVPTREKEKDIRLSDLEEIVETIQSK